MTWDKSPSPTKIHPSGAELHQRDIDMMLRRRRLSREERKELMYALIPSGRYGTTMYSLAAQMKLQPSTYLLQILAELCNEGRVVARAEPHRPNVQKWVFRRIE